MSDSAYFGMPPISSFDLYIGIAYFAFPPGKPPKFDPNHHPATVPLKQNIESRAYLLYASCYTTIAIMVATTVLRLFVRSRGKAIPRFGWDDYLIIPAVLFGVGTQAIALCLAYHAGAGKHTVDVTYREISHLIPLIVYSTWLNVGTLAFAKLSILMFYRRLTLFTKRSYQIIIWTIFGLVIVWGVIGMFMFALQCNPVKAAYDMEWRGQHPTSFKCLPTNRLNNGIYWGHVALDFVLIALPIWVVVSLQMPIGTKVRVCAVFCVAFLSIAASIIRTRDDTSKDLTYDIPVSRRVVWGSIDYTTAIMVANLPALNSLATSAWAHTFSLRVRSVLQNVTSGRSTQSRTSLATDSESKDAAEKDTAHINAKEATGSGAIGVDRQYHVTTGPNPGDIEKGLDWGRGVTSAEAKSS